MTAAMTIWSQSFSNWQNGRTHSRAWRDALMRDPCVYCGDVANGLDHIIAQSNGGGDGWANRAPACRSCDQLKGAAGLIFFLVVRHNAFMHVQRRQRRYRTLQAMASAFKQRVLVACHEKERLHNLAMKSRGSVAEPGIAPPC